MSANIFEIPLKDREPTVRASERTIIVTGKWIKLATVKDEELAEGPVISDPEAVVREFKKGSVKADIFTFPQKISDAEPRHRGYFEYDNMAAIPVTTYEDWWNKLSQDTRRNVRKAGKQGVVIKVVKFDDEFARGVKAIYDETPVRQGRRFSHYGKDFEIIKRETSTYLERSEFIGAYSQDELIGFLKMVYTDRNAHIIHFLSKNSSYEMRPANLLVAKAVEICAQRGCSHLVYRKYDYGQCGESSLTEFKRRNGFEEIRFPRYFLPLSVKGRVVLKLRMHHGVKEMLPQKVVAFLRKLRANWLKIISQKTAAGEAASL